MQRLRPSLDHDHLAAWVEHMKGVYQRTIDKHAASGKMEGGDIIKARNHLKSLAMIQVLLTEHQEMASGQRRDYGHSAIGLTVWPELVKPNGEVIPIRRKPRPASEASGEGSLASRS